MFQERTIYQHTSEIPLYESELKAIFWSRLYPRYLVTIGNLIYSASVIGLVKFLIFVFVLCILHNHVVGGLVIQGFNQVLSTTGYRMLFYVLFLDKA